MGERREIACRSPCASVLPLGECMAITVGVKKLLIKNLLSCIASFFFFFKIKCKISSSSKAMHIEIFRQSTWAEYVAPFF